MAEEDTIIMKKTVAHYLQLTKPSIMLLVVFTGTAALVIEGSLLGQPVEFLLVLLGLFLSGGIPATRCTGGSWNATFTWPHRRGSARPFFSRAV